MSSTDRPSTAIPRPAIPYTPTDRTDAEVAELLGVPGHILPAARALAYGQSLTIPGVHGLFGVSVHTDARASLSPLLAVRPEGTPGARFARNALDLREHYYGRDLVAPVELDPRAVAVEGITQQTAGWILNGSKRTTDLELIRYREGGRWSVKASSYGGTLTDAARARLESWANSGAADALVSPTAVAASRLLAAVSDADEHMRKADVLALELEADRLEALAALELAQLGEVSA